MIAVKALACELPWEHGIPVSRLSTSEIRRAVVDRGIVASVGETTVWRWLSEDAIRPWCHRSWIFPRAPDFLEKAGRVLDLYQGRWRGRPLTAGSGEAGSRLGAAGVPYSALVPSYVPRYAGR